MLKVAWFGVMGQLKKEGRSRHWNKPVTMLHLSPDIESTKYGFEFAEFWKFPLENSVLLFQHGKQVSGEVNKANQTSS